MLYPGTQDRIVAETTSGAGTTVREGAIRSDSLVATLWVESIESGTLDVVVYALTNANRRIPLFSFPTLTAPSELLVLKKAGVSLARFVVEATYTGVCSYEVYIRATNGIGESTTRLVGADQWSIDQATVGTTALLIVSPESTDRQGVVVKNWNTSGDVFLAPTESECTTSAGYPLAPRDGIALDINAGAAVWAVTDSGTVDVRIATAGGA